MWLMKLARAVFGVPEPLSPLEREAAALAGASLIRKDEEQREAEAARKAAAARHSRDYRYRHGLRRRAGVRQCGYCEATLIDRRADARFCSGSCRANSHRRQAEQVTTDTPLIEDSGKKASA